MTNRNPILVDLPAFIDPPHRLPIGEAVGAALERTVGDCETLSLDSESDRAVLISRLKRALGLSA